MANTNMVLSPFLKSAPDIGKKGYFRLADINHFCLIQLARPMNPELKPKPSSGRPVVGSLAQGMAIEAFHKTRF